MGALEQLIREAIKKEARKLQFAEILTGTATKVGDVSCTVEREDAPTLYNVKLNAESGEIDNYVTIYPKDGSEVVVGILEGLKTDAVILRCSEVEKVKVKIGEQLLLIDEKGFVFNEGKNAGLVLIVKLIERINRLEDKLKSHQHGYIPYPGGTAGPPVATTPATALIPPDLTLKFNNTKQSEIEDVKIKH